MKHSDIALLMKAIAPTVGDLVAGAVRPLAARIEELERQLAERPLPEKGDPGEVDMAAVERMIAEGIKEAVVGIAPREPEPNALRQLVADEVAKLPAPEPGKDADMDAVKEMIRADVEKAIAGVEPRSPDPEVLRSLVAEEVAKLPPAEPGKDAEPYEPTAEELRSILAPIVEEVVAAIPEPKDGVGLAGAFQNKDGHLILTLTNGATADVGMIAGKDGQDGAPGKDGADALGFDDLVVEHDGERGFAFKMQRGDQVKEFAFSVPVVIDRGVWSEGREGGYAKGDGCTWAGSFWISQKNDNADKPDGGDGWRLAVKRGRDGRNGEAKAPAPKTPIKVG